MKVWKKTLPPIGFAIASAAFFACAVLFFAYGRIALGITWLSLAVLFFALAVLFFARGRKSGGGARPPNA